MAHGPEMKFRLGNMTATIWRNEKFHSVTLSKSYKDGRGDWQETNSLNPGDLRRTFRTGLSKLGVAPHIAERLMHHISAADPIERTYDTFKYVDDMRQAMLKWDGYISELVKRS